MMRVLITGTSTGIGRGTAIKFLDEGFEVIGFDIEKSTIDHAHYTHYIVDVAYQDQLPDIEPVDILICNAGVQNSGRDIEVNLKGLIYCTEKYGIQPNIKSILLTASVSAHNGAEFPEYCASKGGVLAYTKNVAMRVAKYGDLQQHLRRRRDYRAQRPHPGGQEAVGGGHERHHDPQVGHRGGDGGLELLHDRHQQEHDRPGRAH